MPYRSNKKFDNLSTRRNYGLYERANKSVVNKSTTLKHAEKNKSNLKLAKLLENIKPLTAKLNAGLLKLKSVGIDQERVKSGALAMLLIFSIVVPFLPTEFAKAATATVLPDGDVTTQWAGQATPHWSKIDENVSGTPDTNDFIATGDIGTSADNAMEELTFETISNVASVSSVVVRILSKSQTNANGGTLDNLQIQLRIGGVLQAVQTITPQYNATATTYPTTSVRTFSGSWTQSDLDGMQVLITRVTLGSGNPTNQRDDVRIAAMSADVTYTPLVNFEQSAYRWFNNADSTLSDVTSWKQVSTNTGLGANTSGIENYTVFNNKMWTIGPVYGSSKNVYSSNDGSSWTLETSTAPWESSRSDMSSLAYNSKLWMIGGDNNDDTNEVYSSSNGINWTQETAAAGWSVRGNYPETVFNNKMWIFGGWDDVNNLWYNDVWSSSDGINWTQETASAGWSARHSHQVTVFNGKLWMFGGRNSAGSSLNDVWSSSDGINWTQETASAGWSARYRHSVTSYNGYMWVMGGQNSTPAHNNEIWRSADGISWTQVANTAWSARSGIGLYNYDSRLWVIQGTGNSNFTDAWHTVGPGIDIASPLGALSTPVISPSESTIFRLRLNLHASIGSADPASYTFKLQYAQRGVDNLCDTSFTSETYSDLSSSSGVIRYANNIVAYDDQPIVANVNDPIHSGHTVTPQSYEEANNFTVANTIANGNDGMWDFALVDYSAPASTTYCFRAVRSSGAVLSSYSVIPQITTATVLVEQSGYRWFENSDTSSPTTLASTWGGSGSDLSVGLSKTNDGGYITTGYTSSYGGGGQDAVIVKYDASGIEQWSKTWGGGSNDRGHAVIQTIDGGYAIAGYTASFNTSIDQLLVKFDSAGVEQWSKPWGGTGLDEAVGLVGLADGSLITVGYSNSSEFTAGLADATIIKYNSAGVKQWSKLWGGTNTDVGIAITKTSDNGFVITGYQSSYSAGGIDNFLVKFDSSGVEQWSKSLGGAGEDRAYGVSSTSDGGYITAGFTNTYGAGSYDQMLVKYSSTGVEQWTKVWGGTGDDRAYAVTETSDGGYAVSGYTSSYGAGAQDHTLVKYNSSGIEQWSKTWGGTGNDLSRAVIEVASNYLISSGTTASYGAGSDDQLILKFDTTGNIANCGSPICQDITITESDIVITETDHVLTEVNSTHDPGYITITEADQTASSVQTYVAGHLTFSKALGGASNEQGTAVIQSSDGGYVVVGESVTFSVGQGDKLITKYSANGTEQWSRSWGGLAQDSAVQVVEATDGGFVVLVNGGDGHGGGDIFLVKYNSSGIEQWSKYIGGTSVDLPSDMVLSSDGGYIISGLSNSFGNGYQGFLTKFNSSGIEQWSKTWGSIMNDSFTSVLEGSDGSIYAAGYTFSAGSQNQLLVKFNSSGIMQWSKTWGGSSSDVAVDISEVSGDIFVAGNTQSYGAGGQDQTLVKYNSSGIEQWSKTWGGSGEDETKQMIKNPDGSIVVVGYTTSYGAGSEDQSIVKYNSSGEVQWSKTWGGSGFDRAQGVANTNDGGFVVTGYTFDYGAGSMDITLNKYDVIGRIGGCTATPCGSNSTIESDVVITETDIFIAETNNNLAEVDSAYTEVDRTSATTETVLVSVAPWENLGALPGNAISTLNTALNGVQRSNAYRLRLLLHISGKSLSQSTQNFKLQAAPKVGTCDIAFVGEQYSDVTNSSALKYHTGNLRSFDGDAIGATADDPSHNSDSVILQTFETANNFTNNKSMDVGSDGLWDFALFVDESILGGSYCLRVVESNGTPLSSYSFIPEIVIPPILSQKLRHGRFFTAGGESQPFKW